MYILSYINICYHYPFRLEMESVSRDLVSRQDARRPPDITDILRVPVLRKRACILFFVWFSVSICYYGITYYVPNLFGDKHLNFMLGKRQSITIN